MLGGTQTNGGWLELARIPAPVGKQFVWRVMLDKTEHPERYNPCIARADVLDQDATVVLRRTWPTDGEPFAEYVRHAIRCHRVEYQRYGREWSTAQALVDTEDGPHLVYEVYRAAEAEAHAGIDVAHARRMLQQLWTVCAEAEAASTAPDPSGCANPLNGKGLNGNGRNGSV